MFRFCDVLLLLTVVLSFLTTNKKLSLLMLACSLISFFFEGSINFTGAFLLLAFYLYSLWHFKQNTLISFLFLIGMVSTFILHLLPGFSNFLLFDQMQMSITSKPFTSYVNADKIFISLIIFLNSPLQKTEKPIDLKAFKTTLFYLSITVFVLLSPAFLTHYIKFDLKYPPHFMIWALNNLFFVCFSEEVVFRGLLQKRLKELIPKKLVFISLSSLLFGLYHYDKGLVMIVLSFLAGIFYGLTYDKTQRLTCSMLVHFGLNLIHLICFTYPSFLTVR
ncbi:MAG: CPBP family intramembrane glutamic endopeptidase [Rhabdochlamydiaceae bacterium]